MEKGGSFQRKTGYGVAGRSAGSFSEEIKGVSHDACAFGGDRDYRRLGISALIMFARNKGAATVCDFRGREEEAGYSRTADVSKCQM